MPLSIDRAMAFQCYPQSRAKPSRRFVLKGLSGIAASLGFGPSRADEAQLRVFSLNYHSAAHDVIAVTDVRAASEFLKSTGGPVSLYSSGHCFEGTSVSQKTVLDLRALNRVVFNPKTKTLSAGPAATIQSIHEATTPHGWVLPAGNCQTVAAAGLSLGGGYGALSRLHGLTADHLIDADVVLVDGSIIENTATQAPDLFWGLRGAGTSLALATRLEFKLRPAQNMTVYRRRYAVPLGAAVKIAVQLLKPILTAPRPISGILHLVYGGNGRYGLEYRLIESGDRKLAQRFFERSAIASAESVPAQKFSGTFKEAVDEIWEPGYYPQFHHVQSSDYMISSPEADQIEAVLKLLSKARPSMFGFLIDVSAGGAVDATAAAAMAFPHRGPISIYQYACGHEADEDVTPLQAIISEMKSILAPTIGAGQYLNYPDPLRVTDRSRYWLGNFARLQSLKRHYDPDNRINHAASVPL